MPGLRSRGPAAVPATVPRELQLRSRRDMQLDSKRPRDGQKGSDVQNSDMDESTNDSARPLKLKRSKHSALTEINENTGRQVPTSSVVVNNVHIDSFAKQTSADSCATAYAECGSSHFSGDILSGVRDSISSDYFQSIDQDKKRERADCELSSFQSTPLVQSTASGVAAFPPRTCVGEVFSTPSSLPVESNMLMSSPLGAPKVTPREEVEQLIDVDSEYHGSDYDTKYSKQLTQALLEREELYLQPAGTYSAVQVEVSLDDHAELVDWMAEVVYIQELQIDVLYLGVHIMDCVLRLKPMKRKSFQLLGATCIFLASKLEEVQAISSDTIARLAGNAFRVDDLVKMEIFITAVLDYTITIPTRLQFIDRIFFAADLNSKEIVFSKYLLELSLHDVTFNRFRFSKVAAAAVNLARQTLRPLTDAANVIWNPVLRHYSHYTDEELVDAVFALHLLHGSSESCIFFAATVAKYETVEYFSVSRLMCPRPHDLRFSSSLACDYRSNRHRGAGTSTNISSSSSSSSSGNNFRGASNSTYNSSLNNNK